MLGKESSRRTLLPKMHVAASARPEDSRVANQVSRSPLRIPTTPPPPGQPYPQLQSFQKWRWVQPQRDQLSTLGSQLGRSWIWMSRWFPHEEWQKHAGFSFCESAAQSSVAPDRQGKPGTLQSWRYLDVNPCTHVKAEISKAAKELLYSSMPL